MKNNFDMKNINIGIANLFVTKKLKDAYFNNSMLEESKTVSTDFFEIVKNSPILQLEYKVFNNIESKHIDNDLTASRYIDNNIKLFEIYTLSEIEKEHSKLEKFINKLVNIDEAKYNLYLNIENLITESLLEPEKIDVDSIHESFTYVLNHIKEPKSTETKIDSKLINENVIEIAINKFIEKYNSLNEEDKTLLKKILRSTLTEKEAIFEEIKKENLTILEKVNAEGIENKISRTIAKLTEMTFNKKTIDSDIIQLHELKKGLL